MKLAPPGDPLVKGNGSVLPAVGATEGSMKVPTQTGVPNAYTINPKVRRSSSEFPSDEKTQTVLNAVLVYHLLGMSNNELAFVLNTTVQEIESIKHLPAFQETFELLFGELLSAKSNSLQARISSYAEDAVESVHELAMASKNDEGNWDVPPIVKLKASQDILDRSGLAAETLFGNHGKDGDDKTLQVIISDETDNKTKIEINMGKRRG